MKRVNRIAALLLTLAALMAALPATALAAGSIDLNRAVSLTLSYQDGETPLVGAELALYLVATVDDCGELTATEPFAPFNVNIRGKNDAAWQALASTLEGYVLRDGLSPADTAQTGPTGQASFPSGENTLTPGLYLVLGQRLTQNGMRYDPAPFFVLLPTQDKTANQWAYCVSANGKFTSSKIPGHSDKSDLTRKVLKIWEDDGHDEARPAEITVQLLRDGAVYDSVTLSAANNWRYTWTGLSRDHQWTVTEDIPDHYVPTIVPEGITFVITNTYTGDTPDTPNTPDTPDKSDQPDSSETPDQPKQPDTPDSSGQDTAPTLPQTGQLWWPVPVLLCGGLLCIVLGLIRRRGART